MNRVISKSNINILILPLTDPACESLEDYLGGKVVGIKCDEEFVWVVGPNQQRQFSLVSYGRYDQAEFTNKEKLKLKEEIIFYGKEWLKNDTDYIF